MIYGLTNEGLVIKDFSTITKEIQAELTQNLGQINFQNNSVAGNIVNILAEREIYIWQLCQALYSSMSPEYAEGISLDYNCALLGIKRLPATYSYVTVQVTGENYSTLPIQTAAKLINAPVDTLYNRVELEINNESCTGIDLEVTTADNPIYKIVINNVLTTYTKQETDTTSIIASKLAESLNSKTELSIIATIDESNKNIIHINSKEFKTNFSYFTETSSSIKINSVTNNVIFYAKNTGAIAIPSNSVRISSIPEGILSINNFEAGFTGQDVETDLALRTRRRRMLMLNGRATVNSIRAKLMNLNGVTAVTVNENSTNQTLDSLPPYNFEAIVSGGSDEDIARAIWEYKPIGIKPYGTTSKDITDSTANIRTIYFSRPTQYYVFIDISITKNEYFNDESIENIKTDIVENYKTLKLGDTLFCQSLFGLLYKQKGINRAEIKLGKSSNASASSVTTASENLSVDGRSILVVENKRINIVVS